MSTENKKIDKVSVVIPIYNEEKYITKLIDSIATQDYGIENFEVIFVDGNSTDKTIKVLESKIKTTNIDYKIINNEKRLTPISVNKGIKESQYDIIIRLDAHSEYPTNYISKCVYYKNKTGADNVGCLFETVGEGKTGKAIENVLKSKFGVGNSGFRTNAKSGYVDTVPYGTFKKSLFEKIGYFNEELIRSEDNEINYRIIKNGGKVYLFNDIAIKYHPRSSISKLIKMAFQNGKWVLYTSYLMPGSMKLRHFIPMIFVLGLILGLILSLVTKNNILALLYFGVIGLYVFLDVLYTIKSILKDGISQIKCIYIYPLFHISYGIGTFFGIGKILKKICKKKG